MQGTFGNKAIKYYAVGRRVLGSAWLQVHMIDAAKPSQYQADVFFGYDDKAGDFIVHWLDTSGAAGARVVATGHRDGERLVVVFPYAAGTLRDTFQRDTSRGTWTVLVESREQAGTWSAFGNFRLTRPMKQEIGHSN
jgi:hypothetical protein